MFTQASWEKVSVPIFSSAAHWSGHERNINGPRPWSLLCRWASGFTALVCCVPASLRCILGLETLHPPSFPPSPVLCLSGTRAHFPSPVNSSSRESDAPLCSWPLLTSDKDGQTVKRGGASAHAAGDKWQVSSVEKRFLEYSSICPKVTVGTKSVYVCVVGWFKVTLRNSHCLPHPLGTQWHNVCILLGHISFCCSSKWMSKIFIDRYR